MLTIHTRRLAITMATITYLPACVSAASAALLYLLVQSVDSGEATTATPAVTRTYHERGRTSDYAFAAFRPVSQWQHVPARRGGRRELLRQRRRQRLRLRELLPVDRGPARSSTTTTTPWTAAATNSTTTLTSPASVPFASELDLGGSPPNQNGDFSASAASASSPPNSSAQYCGYQQQQQQQQQSYWNSCVNAGAEDAAG